MKVWRWIDKQALLLLHDESWPCMVVPSGMRDEGLLDSALARPLNLLAYGGEPDYADLAAAYGVGLAKNIPSSTATSARPFFPSVCSWRSMVIGLRPGKPTLLLTMLAVAAGDIDEVAFAAWIRNNAKPR